MSRILAISDIHGFYRTFYELLINRIDLRKSDRLILLGDYIDRGDQSKEVIDLIIDLIDKGFNVTPLKGNHELMLTDSYLDPDMIPLWLLNNGDATLMSFGIQDLYKLDRKYMDFFMGLDYFLSAGKYLFVHAGFNDYADDPFADKINMVWECRTHYENQVFSGKTIIHGHRPKTIGYVKRLINEKSAVIPIDTGCVYDIELGYGHLSALEINTMELISVPNN